MEHFGEETCVLCLQQLAGKDLCIWLFALFNFSGIEEERAVQKCIELTCRRRLLLFLLGSLSSRRSWHREHSASTQDEVGMVPVGATEYLIPWDVAYLLPL